MGITTYPWRTVAAIISIIAMFALVACTSEDATAAAVPTQIEPTPTAVVIEVTAAPIPTETPVPTATPEPTVEVEPTALLTEDEVTKLKEETRSQPMVEFPAKMLKGSEPLTSDQVLLQWEEFITGTRSFAFNDSLIWEVCSGGEGTWVYEVGSPAFTGAKFDWELRNDPGGSWNSVVIIIKMQDQKLFDLMNYSGGDGLRVGLTAPAPGEPSGYYESAECN
jgi:hypothetical protein